MKNEQAFETLLAGLAAALNESLERHSAAASKGDLKALEAETELQRQLVEARKKLQALQKAWPLPIGKRPAAGKPAAPRPKAKRAPRAQKLKRGQKPPQDAYVLPILQALDEMGGRGAVPDVLDRVGQIMADDFNEHDRSTVKSGDIRWRTTAHWARHEMKEQGLLAAGSRRGIWEITEEGRVYLRDLSK
ncbi:MAG: hypothetical protein EHM56_00960 [Chloroflexi bacterium]|nr:MAG: hypothetical protein EHM56_00960 [Chloroflexota bacterium]